jgi:hypothetical protein
VSAGLPLDRHLVESAALLHDVDKLERVRPQVAGLAHAEGSAAWLASQGYPELGPIIVGHPVTRLADATWFEGWLAAASPEALIVAYSDKRAGQRLESMPERFVSWKRRYPPADRAKAPRGTWTSETLAAVVRRAEVLEARVCGLLDIAPTDVRRLNWTGRAIAAARPPAAARGGEPAPVPARGDTH